MKNENLLERITVEPDVMVGKPVIRGTRIPVALILKMLGQGIPTEEILREYPRLERVDFEAAICTKITPLRQAQDDAQDIASPLSCQPITRRS